MLPFENKKRKRQERLNMQQKQWICQQKMSEPTITDKNLALLFQSKIRYEFEKDLTIELEELYRLTNISQ